MVTDSIRVGVAGARGRLGRAACAAIAAAPDLTLVAGFVRDARGPVADPPLFDDLQTFYEVGMDVVVDCSVYPISVDIAREAVDAGVAPVIGATGWTDEDLVSFADRCDEANIGALLVPNFSLGANLMIRFAAEAVRYLPDVEIIELHRAGKRDAPSGTARLTAGRIADAGGPSHVPIHSVRLPGLAAHQEIIFGAAGETLTIRHDSLGHDSFAGGIVFAARSVRGQSGLRIGLDGLLFAPEPA